jgi:hypothetical protein
MGLASPSGARTGVAVLESILVMSWMESSGCCAPVRAGKIYLAIVIHPTRRATGAFSSGVATER